MMSKRVLTGCGVGLGIALGIMGPACDKKPPGSRPPQQLTCADGTLRAQIDCSTDLGLKEKVVAANASLGNIGLGIGAKYEERAVGQVTDSTYQLALRLESLCKEYNACVMTPQAYSAEAGEIRSKLDQHVGLVQSLDSTTTAEIGDTIWSNARPDLAGDRLSLRYALEIDDGKGSHRTHADGAVLHSGDSFRVQVHPSHSAYVYILLISSTGEASQLFPLPEMGLRNPLAADSDAAIPNDGTFDLDAVTGEESLQILASTKPLTNIEARLAALSQSTASAPAAAAKGLLSGIGELVCPGSTRGIKYSKAVAECEGHKTRGITYRKAKDTPVRVAARPNDDVIVIQHRIDHR